MTAVHLRFSVGRFKFRRPPAGGPPADDGRAVIEVIFLGVLMLIPTVYILIALLRIQAANLAVSQAARDAGRVMDAATTVDQGQSDAHQVALIDLQDQKIPTAGLTIMFVTTGAHCTPQNTIQPSLQPGAIYDVCVTATLTLPGVPTVLTGSKNTITGVYTVHISDLREGT